MDMQIGLSMLTMYDPKFKKQLNVIIKNYTLDGNFVIFYYRFTSCIDKRTCSKL